MSWISAAADQRSTPLIMQLSLVESDENESPNTVLLYCKIEVFVCGSTAECSLAS